MQGKMKYYSTLNLYKAPNVSFDPHTMCGYSYGWYSLVKPINNSATVVVNEYSYSATTIRHISKIRHLLNELGIEYVTLEAPKGLQNLAIAREHYHGMIKDLLEQLNNPRCKRSLDIYRYEKLIDFKNKLALIDKIDLTGEQA